MNTDHVQCERLIVACLIIHALDQGYTITVDDGDGSTVVKNSTDPDEIWANLFTMSEDVLILYRDGKRLGFIHLIYGNGTDVVSDYADYPPMVALLEPISSLSERLYETDPATLLRTVHPTPEELSWVLPHIIGIPNDHPPPSRRNQGQSLGRPRCRHPPVPAA